MSDKSNLFFFATKELTQDAFLRWLFENFNDTELKNPVRSLLQSICDLQLDEEIQSITTTAQWHHIDVSIWIKTNKRKIAVFIEDKTFTSEHWQLKTYNTYIKKCINEYGKSIYPIYYKIGLIGDEERQRIEDAIDESIKWTIYDTKRIFELLKEYMYSNNLLFRQYIEYIANVYQVCFEPRKPVSNESKIDLLQWEAFFNTIIIPQLEGRDKDFWCGSWKAGQYPYVCFHVEKTGYDNRVPYLEISSKDCVNDQFVASILAYDVDTDRLRGNRRFLERIEHDVEMNKFRHTKKMKTLAKSRVFNNINTAEAFLELTKRFVDYYLELMSLWE